MKKKMQRVVTTLILLMTTIGCESKNERVTRMATEHAKQQAKQSQQMLEAQQEVARGSRQLVESDARAREEIVGLHRDIRSERKALNSQHHQLEIDRKAIAKNRYQIPIIVEAVKYLGMTLLCLLPLLLCWHLLTLTSKQGDEDIISEQLLEDMVSDKPVLLPRPTEYLLAQQEKDVPPADS